MPIGFQVIRLRLYGELHVMPIFQLMREVSPHMMKIFLHLYCLISSLVLGGERPHVVVCEAVSTAHVLKVSSGDNLMHHMKVLIDFLHFHIV